MTFEDGINKIDELIARMESGELDLDNSIEDYSTAMKTIAECHKILDSAEGKVQKIINNKKNIKFEDFE